MSGLLLFAGGLLVGLVAGAVAGIVAARRRAAEKNERALRDLAHDLRTPITVIRGQAELVLSRDDLESGEREGGINAIVEAVEEMDRMIGDRRST